MDLIEELRKVMAEKSFSCETMSKFVGCSGKQIDRWLSGESQPTFPYQKMIRAGIRRVKKI
ncbi:hypothetical protein ES707_14555 [subsurface metagenome]